MKLLIGLVGPIGAGKETFVDFFKQAVGALNVTHLRTNAPLKEELARRGLPNERENLQNLALEMERTHGIGALARILQSRIDTCETHFVIYDCIRLQPDFDLVTSYMTHLIVYITALPKVRWKRTRKRASNPREANWSFAEFMAAEQSLTETNIERFGQTAHFTIMNNRTDTMVRARFKHAVGYFTQYYAQYKLRQLLHRSSAP